MAGSPPAVRGRTTTSTATPAGGGGVGVAVLVAAVLAAAVVAAAWPARGVPMGAYAVGVGASAVVYVGTFFLAGVASDFRYAYWCVLAALAGGVATAAARSKRAVPAQGRQAHRLDRTNSAHNRPSAPQNEA